LGVGGLSGGQGRQPATQVPAVQGGEADREQGAEGYERAPIEQDQAVVQVGGTSGEQVHREAQQAEEEGEAQRAEQQGQRPAPQRLHRPGGREAAPQQERHRDSGQDPRRRVIDQRLERPGDRLVHQHQHRSRHQAPKRAIDRPQHDELLPDRFGSGHKTIITTRPRLGSRRFRY